MAILGAGVAIVCALGADIGIGIAAEGCGWCFS